MFYEDNYFITKRLKLVSGKAVKDEKVYPRVRFYDEKEWRLFPDINKELVNVEKYVTGAASTLPKLDMEYAKFDIVNDLEYIIISHESEFGAFLKFINSSFPMEKDYILPKVLFYNRLKSDI